MFQAPENNLFSFEQNSAVENLYDKISSPFKNALFWPKEKEKVGKKKCVEKVPSIITSSQWRKYTVDKEKKKRKEQEKKDLRRKIRLEKQIIKKEKIENKKKGTESKKIIRSKSKKEKITT